MSEKVKPVIVSATGSTSGLGIGVRGQLIEEAMSKAVYAAEKEAQAIWEDTSLPEEERREKVAAIMSPDAIRERKIAARAAAKVMERDLATGKASRTNAS